MTHKFEKHVDMGEHAILGAHDREWWACCETLTHQ